MRKTACPRLDGSGGVDVPAKAHAPPVKYKTYFNEREGAVEQAPEGVGPAFNWNQGKAGAKAVLQKLEESKQNYKQAAALKPKKERITKKKLEGDIADLDAQIKGAGDKKAAADLEAKKVEKQALLDKKTAAADKKKLLKEQAALQKELDGVAVKTYGGIWKDEVTTVDWPDKSESVQSKKDYFQNKLNDGGLADADKTKFEQFLKDLDEFARRGQTLPRSSGGFETGSNRLDGLEKRRQD